LEIDEIGAIQALVRHLLRAADALVFAALSPGEKMNF